jgi:hypothetical protein
MFMCQASIAKTYKYKTSISPRQPKTLLEPNHSIYLLRKFVQVQRTVFTIFRLQGISAVLVHVFLSGGQSNWRKKTFLSCHKTWTHICYLLKSPV